MVKEINVEQLILNHFSSRYSNEEIVGVVRKKIKEIGVKIPVRLVFPGEIHKDILSQEPVNA